LHRRDADVGRCSIAIGRDDLPNPKARPVIVGEYDAYVVDFVKWLKRFVPGDCVVMKMDIEGEEARSCRQLSWISEQLV